MQKLRTFPIKHELSKGGETMKGTGQPPSKMKREEERNPKIKSSGGITMSM